MPRDSTLGEMLDKIVLTGYSRIPVMLDTINPFMDRQRLVLKPGTQEQAARSLTRNFTYADCWVEDARLVYESHDGGNRPFERAIGDDRGPPAGDRVAAQLEHGRIVLDGVGASVEGGDDLVLGRGRMPAFVAREEPRRRSREEHRAPLAAERPGGDRSDVSCHRLDRAVLERVVPNEPGRGVRQGVVFIHGQVQGRALSGPATSHVTSNTG